MLHPELAFERCAALALCSGAAGELRRVSARLQAAHDVEAVHQLRVELRRLRTLLRTLQAAMPVADLAQCIEDCRWLAGRSGGLRDLDVMLQSLRGQLAASEFDAVAGPRLLLRALRADWRRERRRLLTALRARRTERLLGVLERIGGLSPHAPGWSAAPVAATALGRAYRRVVKQGRRARESGAAPDVHELRKRCKRLRYLLEFFAPRFPGRHVAEAVNRLRKLQNALGQFQDCTVQAEILARLRAAMQARGGDTCVTLIDRLLAGLTDRGDAAARLSVQRFDKLIEHGRNRRLRRLFEPDARLARPWIGTAGYCHGTDQDERIDLPVGKIVCIGRNYAAHAAELGNPVPEQPLLFIKPPSAAASLGPVMCIPAALGSVHHELEIAVLIGSELRNANAEQARAAIAGIGLGIDLTLRELQDALKAKGHPWERAKGFDGAAALSGFAPLDANLDLENLELRLAVNGRRRQFGSSAQMLTPIVALIALASAQFTLWPGDVLLTGTPKGVGPLRPGDRLSGELRGVLRLRAVIADTGH